MQEHPTPEHGSIPGQVSWSRVLTDATTMLCAEEDLSAGMAQVCERPFDPQVRAALVDLLTHPRWAEADAAAGRVVLQDDKDEQ